MYPTFEPTGGVWQIFKDIETGKLIGPAMSKPYHAVIVVYAIKGHGQWIEISKEVADHIIERSRI